MVAKPTRVPRREAPRLNLAKIHMVAKLVDCQYFFEACLNLAKIHMVAKPTCSS